LRLRFRFLGYCALLFVHEKNARSILPSSIRPLAIDFGGIMRPPEEIEQFVVGGFRGIKRDLYGFGVLHIARHGRGDARRLLKNCLGAPKTTTREIGHVCLATVHLGAKCHA
jgi:hypothetical protein